MYYLQLNLKGMKDMPADSGSLRFLVALTGIKEFPCGILFAAKSGKFRLHNTNLVFDTFPDHPLFNVLAPTEKIVLGKCTYFKLDHKAETTILLTSDNSTNYYSQKWNYKDRAGSKPLMILNEYEKGLVVSLASTELFTENPERGINVESNEKFISNLLSTLSENNSSD